MSDSIHSGHRQRVKSEFLSGNFNDKTPEHKWLELLLFFCIKQQDTNPLAHELLERYKNLNGVFAAPVDELVKFKGLTENNVILLKMIIPLARRCEINELNELVKGITPENYGEYLLKKYYGLQNEKLGVLFLDAMGRIKNFKFVGDGDFGEVAVSTRAIVKDILNENTNSVILAHNHPNSFALPSKSDIDATARLVDTLKKLGIRLVDHIIVSGGDYISIASSREYYNIFI